MGDVAGTPVPLWSSVLASETRGCRGSDDGLAGRQIALKHGVEKSDRLGDESSARRGGDPEWGLALQFNRFRNSYGSERRGRNITLIQRLRKLRIFVSKKTLCMRSSRPEFQVAPAR